MDDTVGKDSSRVASDKIESSGMTRMGEPMTVVPGTGRRTRLSAFVACLLALVAAVPAWGVRPLWFPGFPQRSGEAAVLTWSPVPGATEYRVLRKTGDGRPEEAYRGAATTFIDPAAPSAVSIEYRIVPLLGMAEGEASDPVVLPGKPRLASPAFTQVAADAEGVELQWTAPEGARFYYLYKAEAATGPFTRIGSFETTRYTDRELKRRRKYHFRVTAVDASGVETPPSETRHTMLLPPYRTMATKPVAGGRVFAGEPGRGFEIPSDLLLDDDGDLLVLDRNGIQVLSPEGEFRRRIRLPGGWSRPTTLSRDRDRNLLLAFPAEGMIRKVDRSGALLKAWSLPAPEGGKPLRFPANPNMVAVDGKGVYWIADSVRGQILKFDPAAGTAEPTPVLGRPALHHPREDVGASAFALADRLFYNPNDDRVYFPLPGSTEIVAVDTGTGEVVDKWNGSANGMPMFNTIGSILFRPNGNILVLDSAMRTVTEFTGDYESLATHRLPQMLYGGERGCEAAGRAVWREDRRRLYLLGSGEGQLCAVELDN
jgi:outer membrane protein assembly factor BamB